MTLTLPRELVDEMVAHARDDLPNECCGVIARAQDGALTLYRTTNGAASPYRFDIPAQELLHLFRSIEDGGGDFLVIYHSHVASPARPSPTDLRMAVLHRGPNPWPYWVLVSLQHDAPSVRAWRIDDGDEIEGVAPTEIELTISDESARRVQLETVELEIDGRVRPRVREREL